MSSHVPLCVLSRSTRSPDCTPRSDRTSSGSVESMLCTRLLTLIAARSGSVPIAKVTVIANAPLPALAERKYSMPSTPLMAWSSGAATVCATVSALAPG